MTYRKILVPLVGHARDEQALSFAFVVAKQFGAHVCALFVRPEPSEALPFMGEGISGAVVQEIIDAAKKAAEEASVRAAASLKKCAAEAGVTLMENPGARSEPTAALRTVQGHFADVVEFESRLSDLVVFGGMAGEERFGLKEALETALIAAGRPVLLCPAGAAKAIGTKIAIGFDGSGAAARAVHKALPFLLRAKQIELFHVASGQKSTLTLDPLRDYLALRGLQATEHVVDPAGHGVGDALVHAAVKHGADLLVIGGYGHSRLREFVLGGVTRHVLGDNAPMPVFLAH